MVLHRPEVDFFNSRLGGKGWHVAEDLLGDGAWPGEGEQRKSQARRLIAAREKMVRAGP